MPPSQTKKKKNPSKKDKEAKVVNEPFQEPEVFYDTVTIDPNSSNLEDLTLDDGNDSHHHHTTTATATEPSKTLPISSEGEFDDFVEASNNTPIDPMPIPSSKPEILQEIQKLIEIPGDTELFTKSQREELLNRRKAESEELFIKYSKMPPYKPADLSEYRRRLFEEWKTAKSVTDK